MSATITAPAAPAHRTFIAACWALWQGLPTMVGISLLWTLATGLTALPAMVGAGAWSVLLVGPWLLITTSAVGAIHAVIIGRSARHGARLGLDPVVTGAGWWAVAACAALIAIDGPVQVAGFALAALTILMGPLVIAYGAVRGRRGLSAIRGGTILAILRPDLALSIAALAVVAVFLIVITVGALGLFLPALVATFTCLAVRAELQRRGVDPE